MVNPTSSTTPIPVSSATIGAIPTLSVDDARARLHKLLSNNEGCRFPCLWGITPGVTTDHDAKAILAPLSSMSDFVGFNSESGTISLIDELSDGQFLSINISYLANEGNVLRVNLWGRDMRKLVDEKSGEYFFQDIYDSTGFGERLDFYMLHQVLSTYGRPDSVLLETLGKFPPPRYGQGHFKLILLYPEQGIVVQYTTEMRVVGKNVEGCLANAHVEMELLPPGNVETFYQLLAPSDWSNRIAQFKPIEKVTSLSMDDFYQKFRQPTANCLLTPARLWPIPEE